MTLLSAAPSIMRSFCPSETHALKWFRFCCSLVIIGHTPGWCSMLPSLIAVRKRSIAFSKLSRLAAAVPKVSHAHFHFFSFSLLPSFLSVDLA